MTIIFGVTMFILFMCNKIKFEMFVICLLLSCISDTLGMIRKDMKNGRWN